jgi:hypothetical protein
MKTNTIEAEDVTRKALLGIDGWYEAYWNAGGGETEARLLARLIGRLTIIGRALRQAGRSVAGSLPPRPIRLGAARRPMLRSM